MSVWDKFEASREVACVAAFVQQRWTPLADVHGLVTHIQDAAFRDARLWFLPQAVVPTLRYLREIRTTRLRSALTDPSEQELAPHYDALCSLWRRVEDELPSLAQDCRQAGELPAAAAALYRELLVRRPGLAETRPTAWEQVLTHCLDSTVAAYDPAPDYAAFPNSELAARLALPTGEGFAATAACPAIVQQVIAQGGSPGHALVAAIYTHFSSGCERLNTDRLASDLYDAHYTLAGGATPLQVLFELVPHSSNRLLQALFLRVAKRPTLRAEEYAEALSRARAWRAMSAPERAKVADLAEKRLRKRQLAPRAAQP